MFLITSRIAAMRQIKSTRAVALGTLTAKESVFLLCIDIADQAHLRLEVESHRIVLVSVRTHFKDRCAFQFSRGICYTRGMHDATVKTHIDLLTRQIHIGILHLGITVEMGCLGGRIIHERILRLISYRGIDTTSLCPEDAVCLDRVVNGLVVFIDSQLQRVHLGSIRLILQRSTGDRVCFQRV